MSKKTIRTIRLSESVSPFGPGAIVDILGESFMAVTGDQWPPARLRNEIECDRLASKVGVQELWAAPSTGDPESPRTVGLDFVRFPSWLFCQECRLMTQWGHSREKGGSPVCECSGRLVPMRFVTVCTEKSHASDIPWVEWVHREGSGTCGIRNRLRFQSSKGASEGLSALEVTCEECGSRRSLGDLRRDVLQRDGFSCRGTQPWERTWKTCGKPLEVQQRGATSLHYGETVSAIDIPEVEGRAEQLNEQIRRHPFFQALTSAPSSPLADAVVKEISAALGCAPDTVRAQLTVSAGGAPQLRVARGSLLAEEFEAFVAAIAGTAPTEDFVTRIESLDNSESPGLAELRSRIGEILLVDRLREVRASIGFSRYRPDSALVPSVPIDPLEVRWFPAVEGYGEGIFVRLDAKSVDLWAAGEAVVRRATRISENQETSLLGQRLHQSSPQYLLLHSFSHAMMTELAFKSGYSAPSLRERIYCEEPGDYAIFIYTTSTDIEGTLGGLVRQGEQPFLAQAIARALEQLSWCPNDPVCGESEPQSIDGLNLSACHACMLAPETSCESSNLLLDRTMLVGNASFEGYFQSALDSIMNDAVLDAVV